MTVGTIKNTRRLQRASDSLVKSPGDTDMLKSEVFFCHAQMATNSQDIEIANTGTLVFEKKEKTKDD